MTHSGTTELPLLNTRLLVPPLRANLIARPRLTARLDEALKLGQRLSLVCARAGAGKSTLVSEWLHGQSQPGAWLTLDRYIDKPSQFCRYLAAAVEQAGVPASLQVMLDEQPFPPAETLLTDWINALNASGFPFVLVLDDYHLIQNEWIHQAVGFLIEYGPPHMHLVLISRVEPPLPLAHLRGRGLLTEIRDQDLRFTETEAAEYLNEIMGLDLPADALAAVDQRIEGWAAGLQMAALSARGRRQSGELEAFLTAFSSTNRFILDYLMEEVLRQQSPDIQNFLLETSILESLSADLCDAVCTSGRAAGGSRKMLADLERANLFVIPLDDERRWYRYHHLFADLLQKALHELRSPGLVCDLHRRAAGWYLNHGLPGEAMDHLLVARDFDRAAGIIEENFAGLMHLTSRSMGSFLLNWIEALPGEVRSRRPRLDVIRANLLALDLRLDAVEPVLAELENQEQAAQVHAHIAAVRAYCANLRGDASRALELAAEARAHPDAQDDPAIQGMAALTLADTWLALDNLDGAGQAYGDLVSIGEKTGQLMIIVPALCSLAQIKMIRGQLQQAEELYARAYEWMLERDGLNTRVRCSYEFGMAELLLARNELDAARSHVETGLEFRRRLGGYALIGELAQMRVMQALGEVDAALEALRTAEQVVSRLPFQLSLLTEFRAARVIQWLQAGDVITASRLARDCRGGSELEQLALARLMLAQGNFSGALDLLERLRELAEKGGRTGRLIEILGLQVPVLQALGRQAEAQDVLLQALLLARPEGFVRSFLDLGRPVRSLLETLRSQGIDPGGEVTALLAAFAHDRGAERLALPPSPDGTIPLTARELEVLRLIAEGMSNKEAAEKLFVSPGTIKQHLKNICRKLDARGRMQAVRRARELHLL